MTMENTRLIQRLRKPANFNLGALKLKDNPFSFGGGMVNGGLSAEAMDLLRPIFSFDYMGAAEFEWGAVPQSLTSMVKSIKDYVPFTIELDRKHVALPWDVKKKDEWKGKCQLYVFCRQDQKEEVESRLRLIAKDEYKRHDHIFLKEHTRMSDSLRPTFKEPDDPDIRGWLEINNHFFFAVDKEMFDKFVGLFTSEEKQEAQTG